VGGNPADDSAPGAGAAYVFTRSGATWSQQAYVKASNTGGEDLFGYRISLTAARPTTPSGERAPCTCSDS
jgi:hypothetical protein